MHFAQFIPLFVISIPFAIGNYFLAPRLGGSSLLWAVLSLIPLVNYIFGLYVAYRVVFLVLDRLKVLPPVADGARPNNAMPQRP